MTQITGKIYQQTNAAGTENRFPRTVMEAVLGLSSYLQQQFGALADIYMPIEGISESKPNQEFVYRKTPNTIKAKALTLDRIMGKSLAWNQLVENGNFSNGTTGWTARYGTLTASNNKGTLVSSSNADGAIEASVFYVSGHKYLVAFNASSSVTTTMLCGRDVLNSVSTDFQIFGMFELSTTERRFASIVTVPGTLGALGFRSYANAGESFTISNIILIDLTLMFGEGHEPSTVAEFEAMYPGYHSYNPGALISNDAESLETVGFNQWDEEWENGYYNATGGKTTASNQICSKNLFPVLTGATYYYKCSNAAGGGFAFYDANKNFVVRTDGAASFTIPAGCCYMGISVGADYGSTYNHDICINLSDPSRNGQYEPYRKSVLPLNLKKIRVISPNVWDEEWELGEYNSSGQPSAATSIRAKNYYPVIGGATYRFTGGNGVICCYDANKTFIPYTGQTGSRVWQNAIDVNNTTFVLPSNTAYIRFYMSGAYGTTYNHDICINKSDPAFNGNYYPYGVMTINGGLKGVNAGCDEIIENKLYRRVNRKELGRMYWSIDGGGFWYTEELPLNLRNRTAKTTQPFTDDFTKNNPQLGWYYLSGVGYFEVYVPSASTSEDVQRALTGVYIDYLLPYEEVYDLATPIPVSMPAGTTEERISPNADGLSAPFCADMTYGMGATEYAETAGVASFALNAQYAEVAARLLTPRTIWGQVFDGSANITGAMTGVSAIDSLMYFDTSNGRIGIGISTPLYNLDVAGTFRAAGNTLIGGTLSVDGKIYAGEAEIESIIPSNTEFDSEHSINIPLWRLEEDGEAEFGNTYIRGILKLRAFYQDDGTFHDATMQYEYDDEDASNCFISADKSIHAPSFVQSSDARLKTNLSPVALTVEQIASAPAVEFNWVGNGQRGAGSIAQYWEEQLPYNVHHNGDLLTMEYGNIALISAIVCARKIQELEEQVKKLEAKINVQS